MGLFIFISIFIYIVYMITQVTNHFPKWRTEGIVLQI